MGKTKENDVKNLTKLYNQLSWLFCCGDVKNCGINTKCSVDELINQLLKNSGGTK